jgi:hypothetical protein
MKRKGIVDLGGKNFAEFLNAELCIIFIIKLAKLLNFASHQITYPNTSGSDNIFNCSTSMQIYQ